MTTEIVCFVKPVVCPVCRALMEFVEVLDEDDDGVSADCHKCGIPLIIELESPNEKA